MQTTKIIELLQKPSFQRRLRSLLIAFILFWTPVIIFSKLAGEILEKEHIAADVSILNWIHGFATPTLDTIFVIITDIGSAMVVLPVTILLVGWLIYKRQHINALIIFGSVTGAAAANFVLKLLFHRTRPALWDSPISESSYSFPSGHAMISCALIMAIVAICWYTRQRWLVLVAGVILIILIGVSRLYLGVHYPTDIIAGWSAALAWVYIVHKTVRKIGQRWDNPTA